MLKLGKRKAKLYSKHENKKNKMSYYRPERDILWVRRRKCFKREYLHKSFLHSETSCSSYSRMSLPNLCVCLPWTQLSEDKHCCTKEWHDSYPRQVGLGQPVQLQECEAWHASTSMRSLVTVMLKLQLLEWEVQSPPVVMRWYVKYLILCHIHSASIIYEFLKRICSKQLFQGGIWPEGAHVLLH